MWLRLESRIDADGYVMNTVALTLMMIIKAVQLHTPMTPSATRPALSIQMAAGPMIFYDVITGAIDAEKDTYVYDDTIRSVKLIYYNS